MQSRFPNSPEDARTVDQNLKMLKIAVQQVALPAKQQIERFKGFDASNEVASDYCNWCLWALNSAQAPLLTPQQIAALQALDRHIAEISGPENSELWTDEALYINPCWQKARELATEVLRQFNWTLDLT